MAHTECRKALLLAAASGPPGWGANLSVEIVSFVMHLAMTTWDTKAEAATGTNYKRVLDYALRPEHVKNVRLGIAGHNLLALALLFCCCPRTAA